MTALAPWLPDASIARDVQRFGELARAINLRAT